MILLQRVGVVPATPTLYNRRMIRTDQAYLIIHEVAAELRSWGGVAVVGAGLSVFAGMPLTSGLTSLVWHALDADAEARQALSAALGESGTSAKDLIGDHAGRLQLAYKILSKHPTARSRFQNGFAQRDRDRRAHPSKAHESLAALFHDSHIDSVVSLNWDSLFEAAYEKLYGRDIAADEKLIFKPHGDVADLTSPWVLPGETAPLSDALLHKLEQLAATRPRLLLIAGYSEADEEVVRKLVAPLSKKWRVARIGPAARGELAVRLSAEAALPRLVDAISSQAARSPWIPVHFKHQHDLGPALSGEGLGPADVAALPAFAETQIVSQNLRTLHRAIITGDSGCGKSGTAYRAASALHREGFEVVRLGDVSASDRAICAGLEALRFPTLAMIDNAHLLDTTLLDKLLEKSDAHLRILAVATTNAPVRRGEIRIEPRRAVSVIANALRQNRDVALAHVRKLDNHVGDGYGDQSFEQRLKIAGDQPTPWRFAFMLTGGWRRVGQHVSAARSLDRADMLLFTIAVRQLVTADGLPSHRDLDDAAKALGTSAAWVTDSLRILDQLRLITSTTHPQCLHLQYASQVIKAFFRDPKDDKRDAALNYINSVLSDTTLPLKGVVWLLDALRFADGLRWSRHEVLKPVTQALLLDRSFSTRTSTEHGLAGYLLTHLSDFVSTWEDVLAAHAADIAVMVSECDGASGGGLASFLNHIDHDHHDFVTTVLTTVNPQAIATSLHASQPDSLWGFSEFLERLAYVGRDAFTGQLPQFWSPEILKTLANKAAQHNSYILGKFIRSILPYDKGLALALVEDNVSSMAQGFSKEPLQTYEDLDDLIGYVLSFDMGLGIMPAPDEGQMKLARQLCAQIDPSLCAEAINQSRLSGLERWARFLWFLRRADGNRAKRVVDRVKLDDLDTWLAPYWADPPSELLHFTSMLALPKDGEPARSWIERHQGDLVSIPMRFVLIAPQTCVGALQKGAALYYPQALGLQWDLAIAALATIAEIDQSVAASSIRNQVDGIAEGLATHQANLYEGSDLFLKAIEKIAPGIAGDIVDRIDPQLALKHWPQLLKGEQPQRRALEHLLAIARTKNGRLWQVLSTSSLAKRRGSRKSPRQD